MSNPCLIKSFAAGAALAPYRFVKPGASDYAVLQAAAATDAIIGVSGPLITSAAADQVDIIMTGIADVELGGTVTRGDLLTSDADGKAVTPAPAAGVNNRTGAVAYLSGVAGDIIPVLVAPGSVQGAGLA